MGKITRAEQYFLDRIQKGDEQAWTEFVDRYNGRLVRFARAKLPQRADAEDVVQETFIAFVRSLKRFRGDCDLETYLFSLARRKIIDAYRYKGSKHVCLIQDAYEQIGPEEDSDPFAGIAGKQQTASWYVRADEQHYLQKSALGDALADFVDKLKSSLRFSDLQLTEMLFYCHLPNKQIAETLDIPVNSVALFKHRALKQIRVQIDKHKDSKYLDDSDFENLLSEIWELQRLSCPKRNTIGAYLLGTLDDDWNQYIKFHLDVLGCRFCMANYEDLQSKTTEAGSKRLTVRIMESTLGFLSRPQ